MQSESVRLLLEYVRGNESSAQEIFDRYVVRLIDLAEAQIGEVLLGKVESEDIVQSAYRSFFRRARENDILLKRSGDLWRVLAAFTVNKSRSHIEKALAAKRDPSRETDLAAIQQLVADAPTEEELLVLADFVQHFLEGLSPRNRLIVFLRLQGESVDGIVAALADPPPESKVQAQTVAAATVRRVLRDAKQNLEDVLLKD